MNDLLIGVLSALLATNQPAAISNLLQQKVGIAAQVERGNEPLERELKRIMEMDDQVRREIDDLITESDRAQAKQPALPQLTLKERIRTQLTPVRKAYDDFLEKHPRHARARIAYGSFLSESDDEEGALNQWLRAKEVDPKEPAAWNNLANYYGHNGAVTNAFVHYARAIELNPTESVYYHNLATTLYMFRAEGAAHFKKTVPEIMEAAMAFYRKALELDPTSFTLATDLAQSYYGFPEFRGVAGPLEDKALLELADKALGAWTNAFRIARDDIERQGVQVHFARWSMNVGKFDLARQALAPVTNSMFNATKEALLRKLAKLENPTPSSAPAR